MDNLVDDRLRLTIGDNKLGASVVHCGEARLARWIDRDQPRQIHFDVRLPFTRKSVLTNISSSSVHPRTCQPAFELQPGRLLSCYER